MDLSPDPRRITQKSAILNLLRELGEEGDPQATEEALGNQLAAAYSRGLREFLRLNQESGLLDFTAPIWVHATIATDLEAPRWMVLMTLRRLVASMVKDAAAAGEVIPVRPEDYLDSAGEEGHDIE